MKIQALGYISAILAMGAILAIGQAWGAKPMGGPPSTPEEAKWFQSASNSMRGTCCSEADGFREGFDYPWGGGPMRTVLQEWKNSETEGEYEVKVLGEWYHVDKNHVVQCGKGKKDQNGQTLPDQPCNPTGGAVVWIMFPESGGFPTIKHYDQVGGIRCFAPGFQS